MKCPYCDVAFHPDFTIHNLGNVGWSGTLKFSWKALLNSCPACLKPIVHLEYVKSDSIGFSDKKLFRVFPNSQNRTAPSE